jgi:hypothetical protein
MTRRDNPFQRHTRYSVISKYGVLITAAVMRSTTTLRIG